MENGMFDPSARRSTGKARRHVRRGLVLSSAIGAALSVPAHAQVVVPPGDMSNSLPTFRDIVRNLGNTVVVTGGGAVDLNVAIRAPRAIIDWSRFDVPAGQSANFRDVTGGSPDREVAVLNRVVGRPGAAIDPSDIFGAINADRNVSVFLLNPTGILFGANSAINTGSFVASTLALSDADFNAGRFEFTQGSLAGTTGAPAGIIVRDGARIDARSGPLVLVSERLDVAGTLRSARDVVMIAASDVSMNLTPGGPVSITINRGTRVPGALRVRGQVTGQNVYLATATRAGINDALLDVGGVVSANTAVATDRGIVLVAGGGPGTTGGVTVADTADTAGRVDLRVGADLTANGAVGGIAMRASGALVTTGALTAANALFARSPGAVRMEGNASADRIAVDGGAILLGVDGASRTLTGRTRASYTTRDGALVAAGDLSLIAGTGLSSGAETPGVGDLVLNATGGNVSLLAARIVAGGTVGVRVGSAGRVLQLGTVTADRLTGVSAGSEAFLDTLRVDGNVDVGDLALVRTLDLSSTGRLGAGLITIKAGDLRLAGATGVTAIELNPSGNLAVSSSSGGIRVGGARAGGNGAFDAADAIDVAFIGGIDVRATAGGALTLGTVEARGAVSAVGDDVTANLLTAGTDLDVTSRTGDVVLGTGFAVGDAMLDAAGDARVGVLQSTRGDVDLVAGGALTGSADAGATLRADAGSVRAAVGEDARIASANGARDVTLTARTLQLGRAVAGSGTVAVATSGDLALASATAGRDVRLTASDGALTVTGDVAAGGTLAFEGESVSLGGVSPAVQQAAGGVTVRATEGDIVGRAGLTLLADTDRTGGEPLILDAARGTIRFAGTTASGGGSAVAVRIAAGQPLVLGNVSGANLLSLGDAGALGPLFTSGPITLGIVTVADGLRVATSDGDITADTIRVTGAGQGASLTASGTNSTIALGSLTAPGAISVNAAGIRFAAIEAGSATLDATGTVRGTTLTADDAIRVSGAGVAIDQVMSRRGGLDARAGDGGLTLGSVAVRGDAALATSAGGSIEVRSIDAASALIDSAAALRIGSARTTGDLRAEAVTTIGGLDGGRAGLTAGGALTVRAGGAALLGDIGGGSVILDGASLDVTAVDAVRDASLTSDAALTLGRATTGGSLLIAAAGDVALPGALRAGGDLLVSGASIALGGVEPVLQSAGGRVDITAQRGGITGRGGLTLRSNADARGSEALVLDATGGDIVFADDTTLQGGPARESVVAVRLGTPGRLVSLGRVDAARFAFTNAERTSFTSAMDGRVRIGALSTTQALELAVRGPLSLGSVDVANGGIDLRATGEDAGIATGALSASGRIVAATTGAFTAAGVESRGADVSITGGTVTLPVANARTTLSIAATAGNAVLGTAVSGGDAIVSATGDTTFAALSSAGGIDARAGGSLRGDRVTATGMAAIDAGSTVRLGEITAGAIGITGGTAIIDRARTTGALALTSRGDLALGNGDAADGATLRAGGNAAITESLSAGEITLAAVGEVTAATLVSRGGIAITGRSVRGGNATAATGATIEANGAVRLDRLATGRGASVRSGTIAIGTAEIGQDLTLTSGGALALGASRVTGAATLDGVGTATLGALRAGTIALRAADAEIDGRLAASSIRIANRDASAAGRMGLGDDAPGADGFRLSNAEFGRLDTDTLTLDAGAGRVDIGALDIGADAGRRTVDLLTTGAIEVGGALSASGTGRSVRIGGGTDAGTIASSIRVTATADGGGRLLVGDNALELRGSRIGIGQASGFLDPLDAAITGGTSAGDAASALVGNSSSALYNAAFGGRPFAAGTTLLSARTLTLNFTDYALVQNTALAGQTSGVVLGGTAAAPVARALTVNGAFGGPAGAARGGNAFALYGTINGVGSNATALLGRDVIEIAGVADSRVNGCAVASVGGGCLTNVLVQPVLSLFDVEGTRLFAVADALVVPFENTVGSSNEALSTNSGDPVETGVGGPAIDEAVTDARGEDEAVEGEPVDDEPAEDETVRDEPAEGTR